MMTFSVVCPTFNSANFILPTLETLVRQTRRPDEVVISDDGSSDLTLSLVERFITERGADIKWLILRNQHQGPGAARNAAIRAAKSEWIAFLDSDDLWAETKVERVAESIATFSEVNFFCHDEYRVSQDGKTSVLKYGRRYRPTSPLPPQIYLANMFSTSAVVCKRDLLIEHGLFDEKLMSAQDYELWLRLSPFIRPAFIHDILGSYVERPGNITSSNLKRRIKNEVRVALMHRHMVPAALVTVRLCRIMLSYLRQYAHYRLGK